MRVFLFLTILLLFNNTGCKQETKEEKQDENGTVVKELASPAAMSSALPHLVSHKGNTLLSWVETKGDTLSTFYYSRLIDDSWQSPKMILQGVDWFVNWADYPMIAENNGNLWSHILKKSTDGTYSYDIKMNLKPKGDTDWNTDVALHTDDTPTEHGFVSVLPYKDSFFINWLDGRNTIENEAGVRGPMNLRAGLVSAQGEVSVEQQLDIRTCDCCQTTSAITENGPVVLYRDRSDDEIRDISIVRQVAGEWTAPKTIHIDNWKIKGCPVNGPKVAALGNDLAVAWFTAANAKPKVQVAFSNDGGSDFTVPIEIKTGKVLGRVDIVLLEKDMAIVSWMTSTETETTLKAVKVSQTKLLGQPIIIAKMNGSRKSGFPQMEQVQDQLYFAWTDVMNGVTKVKTAHVALAEF